MLNKFFAKDLGLIDYWKYMIKIDLCTPFEISLKISPRAKYEFLCCNDISDWFNCIIFSDWFSFYCMSFLLISLLYAEYAATCSQPVYWKLCFSNLFLTSHGR